MTKWLVNAGIAGIAAPDRAVAMRYDSTHERRIMRETSRTIRAWCGTSGLLAVLGVALGCEATGRMPEDAFRAQLKRDCSSEAECRALVWEAWDRLTECRQYLVGNRLRYRLHLERCAYEVRDFELAWAKAKAWDRRRHGVPEVQGDLRYLPHHTH